MKILLAEDDSATRLRLAGHVEKWGYEPVAAKDGTEAWEKFQDGNFDCVISDWMMPGLSGLELVRKIREAERESYVYVILLTGQTDKQSLVEGMEAGADDFLAKPFDKDELRVRLRAGLRIVELERSLVERNEELSVFTSVASHDLREPLRTISSFLMLLQRKFQGNIDEEADKYIGFVMDGAERMRNLISDLLEYARMGSSEMKFDPVSTQEIVQEKLVSLGTAIEECGAEVVCSTLPDVEGDRTQLSQLFQNLLGNGIKYRGDAPPLVQVGAVEQDGEWLFSVKDNGIGIPAEHQEAVFEPFRRLHGKGSKYSGSGVGLAICKKVVERHGGRIWVESNEGGGSCFQFTLPVAKDQGRSPA